MNTFVDPGITFFWLFSTEFRGPVCLTNKNLNSIETNSFLSVILLFACGCLWVKNEFK